MSLKVLSLRWSHVNEKEKIVQNKKIQNSEKQKNGLQIW